MMDEKTPLTFAQGSAVEASNDVPDRSRSKRSSSSWLLLSIMLSCLLLLRIAAPIIGSVYLDGEETHVVKAVTLEAHIMSKCPDARDCLRDLIVPAMANISDKVDFSLSYIGRTSKGDGTVECMHGQEECLGNIIELCAADLYPEPKIYLGFTNCMTMNYTLIPQKELIKDCSLEHGIDFDKLNGCLSKDDGAFGMDLLRNSVARSQQAGVTKSCTVRLNGKVRCIRDGGQWYDCPGGSEVKNLIHDVEKLKKLENISAKDEVIASHYP